MAGVGSVQAEYWVQGLKLQNYKITSLQRPLIWEPARDYEITRLRADRCLFFLGKVKLRDYEITRLQAIIFGTFGI